MQRPSKSYYESNRLSKWWRVGLTKMVRAMMPDGWEKMELLDVGVGDGYTIRLVKPDGKIAGVDFEADAVAAAAERGISAQDGSAYQIPFPPRSFDLVTCIEVLEHLNQPSDALMEFDRVLRPGGHLVVTTPVPSLRWRLIWWLWTKFGPGKKWEGIPHVSDLHIGSHSPQDGGLVAMLEGVGFDVVKTDTCNYGMVAGLLAVKRPAESAADG